MELLVVVSAYIAIICINRSHLRCFRRFKSRRIIRPIIRLSPFFICAAITGLPDGSNKCMGIGLGFLFAIVFLLAQLKTVCILFKKESIELYPKYKNQCEKRRQIIFQIVAGPTQELFYRGSIFVVVGHYFPLYVVFGTSVVLFVLEHILQLQARNIWRITDYIKHAAVGILACILIIFGGSIISACIFHFLVNLPNTIFYSRIGYINE